MSKIYSSPTGPRLAGLHDKIFVDPPPPSSQPNDEDTDMPTYHSQSENTEVATDVQEFISSRGNEYFCEIDEDYLTDRFNLTGLNTEVQHYQYALDLVTDVFDMEVDDDMRESIEKNARHLYGLVHARYVV
ncbi:Casein kinase II subunit, partial [Hortaea werneckii]